MAAIAAMTLPMTAGAQDKVEASMGADMVSNYIWRGQDMGGVAVQPSVGISYKGLSLNAWGSYGLMKDDETKELDFTLSYNIGKLNVGITDYYCVKGNENCPGRYFLYDAHKTAHVFEANVGYDFGAFSVDWYTNFAGADGTNASGDRAYSSYVEANAPFKLGGLEWNATLGVVPYTTSSYERAHNFSVTNISIKTGKTIKISPTFSLPLFGAITANPSTQKLYLTAGFSL